MFLRRRSRRAGRTAARALRFGVVATCLTALVSTGTGPVAAAPGTAVTTDPASVRAQVQAMQKQVEQAGAELARGVTAWETGRAELDVLLQQSLAAERAADAEQLGVAAAQQQFNSVIRAAYVNGMTDDVRTILSIDPQSLARSLETVKVLDNAGVTTRGALLLLTQERAQTATLARQRDTLRQQAQAKQDVLDSQLEALQQRATQAEQALSLAQAKLEQLRAAEQAAAARRAAAAGSAFLAAGGGPACSAPADGQYANGFLPDAVLCPLQTAPGQRLVAAAAAAFDRLSRLRAAQSGQPLCVTDSYRDYAGQVAVFQTKPSLAATPGRSQHGWGLAVDLCGGAERSDSEMFRWLKQNAASFGFRHPDWAEPDGSRPEPWHWEYSPVGLG